MCRSKAVREVTEEAEQTYILGEIDNKTEGNDKWTMGFEINDVKTTFKIDTGSDVTVISEYRVSEYIQNDEANNQTATTYNQVRESRWRNHMHGTVPGYHKGQGEAVHI